jgi:ParB-like chromosome segregation protein Spo0J
MASMEGLKRIMEAVESAKALPEAERAALYNAATRALADLVSDLCDAPVLALQLVPAASVGANDYNPNRVAAPEMELLEQSIRADGLTMPVVAYPDGDAWTVVDGFHRRTVMATRIGARWIPITELRRDRGDRMASTIRHNRARGKHQVDLMGAIVRSLMAEGWDDDAIAERVGLTVEEILRLKQIVGAAKLMASSEYGRAWEAGHGPHPADE